MSMPVKIYHLTVWGGGGGGALLNILQSFIDD